MGLQPRSAHLPALMQTALVLLERKERQRQLREMSFRLLCRCVHVHQGHAIRLLHVHVRLCRACRRRESYRRGRRHETRRASRHDFRRMRRLHVHG